MRALACAQDAAVLLAQADERLAEHAQFVELGASMEPGPAQWRAHFHGGGTYRLEWSDDWACLVLTAELGSPTAERERACLNLALSYNALWREVGSLRMARDGESGALLLIGELSAERVEAPAFDAALVHFEALRRWWSGLLLQAGDELPEAPVPLASLLERV